jgi:N-glycosidase YbiA
VITFYDPRNPHGHYSNFSRHPVTIYGRSWRTSEHAFQAMKFWPHRPDLVNAVHAATTPGRSCHIGRDRSFPIRDDWECSPCKLALRIQGADVHPEPGMFHYQQDGIDRQGLEIEPVLHRSKDIFMYEIVYAKFGGDADLQRRLLATGDEVLVEAAEFDPYWGWGASKNGLNKLGRVLMAVRASLNLGTGEGFPAVLSEPIPR